MTQPTNFAVFWYWRTIVNQVKCIRLSSIKNVTNFFKIYIYIAPLHQYQLSDVAISSKYSGLMWYVQSTRQISNGQYHSTRQYSVLTRSVLRQSKFSEAKHCTSAVIPFTTKCTSCKIKRLISSLSSSSCLVLVIITILVIFSVIVITIVIIFVVSLKACCILPSGTRLVNVFITFMIAFRIRSECLFIKRLVLVKTFT